MSFDESQITLTLDKLGIRRTERPNNNGWYGLLCPFHPDNHIGNAFIHSESGGFKCYAGCGDSNIIKIVMHEQRCTHKEALQFIGVNEDYEYNDALYQRVKAKYIQDPQILEKPIVRKPVYSENQWNFELVNFNPDDYEYTRLRGYTKEFIEHYGIKLIRKGVYQSSSDKKPMDLSENRIFTPIKSSKFGSIFEARKIFSIEEKDWIPKVIYPAVNPNVIIYNEENLNYEEDVYVTEGLAGLPKLWTHLSKNVTSIFGASLEDEQIEILRRFKKRVIFIPDRDDASIQMLDVSRQVLDNSYTLPVSYDDKDPEYVENIIYIEPILTTRYLLNNLMGVAS